MTNNYGDLPPAIAQAFAESLALHIQYVREAGKQIGVQADLLAAHDASKYQPAEFPYYARNFFGVPDHQGFAYAWIHHIHNNPHHWQHWIFPDKYAPAEQEPANIGGVLRMPTKYVLEMVADWMGSSRAYTGSWDMSDWLIANLPFIILHPQSASELRVILEDIGYKDAAELVGKG